MQFASFDHADITERTNGTTGRFFFIEYRSLQLHRAESARVA